MTRAGSDPQIIHDVYTCTETRVVVEMTDWVSADNVEHTTCTCTMVRANKNGTIHVMKAYLLARNGRSDAQEKGGGGGQLHLTRCCGRVQGIMSSEEGCAL